MPTSPTSTTTSSDAELMLGCQLTQMAVHDCMDDFIDFARMFMADPGVIDAAGKLLPFDNEVEGSLELVSQDCLVKKMGLNLMRMDLEPALYTMGLVLTLKESQFNEEKKYVIFFSACKTFEGYQNLVNAPSFREEAETIFNQHVEQYFYPDGK